SFMLLRFSLSYVLLVSVLEYIFLPLLLTGLINRIILRVTPSDLNIVTVCTIKFPHSNNYKKSTQTTTFQLAGPRLLYRNYKGEKKLLYLRYTFPTLRAYQ